MRIVQRIFDNIINKSTKSVDYLVFQIRHEYVKSDHTQNQSNSLCIYSLLLYCSLLDEDLLDRPSDSVLEADVLYDVCKIAMLGIEPQPRRPDLKAMLISTTPQHLTDIGTL